MSGRIFALLAAGGLATLAVVACVDVPDNMRAEFAGPGPNDPDNFRRGTHGTAPPNVTHFKISAGYDAGVPDAAPAAVVAAPVDADAGAVVAFDGGNT